MKMSILRTPHALTMAQLESEILPLVSDIILGNVAVDMADLQAAPKTPPTDDALVPGQVYAASTGTITMPANEPGNFMLIAIGALVCDLPQLAGGGFVVVPVSAVGVLRPGLADGDPQQLNTPPEENVYGKSLIDYLGELQTEDSVLNQVANYVLDSFEDTIKQGTAATAGGGILLSGRKIGLASTLVPGIKPDQIKSLRKRLALMNEKPDMKYVN